MAKLYFRHGAMNSAKTANLLMVAHNYKAQDRGVLILKPSKDTRWGADDTVKSRAIAEGIKARLVSDKQDIGELIKEVSRKEKLYAVLVEESQFLTAAQVRQLAVITVELNLPVLCYGLRCTYMDGVLFEGSMALLYWADSIEEIKNVCEYCTSKATKNLLRINGVTQYSGDSQTVIGDVGGDDVVSYTPVCKKHYFNPPSGK